MMSELVPSALERKQPAVFLSGPSFAKEVMENRPTGLVAASKDAELARTVQVCGLVGPTL
jgi:glycerol-3-phosphate dehydrogenase (NAD+)